MEKGNIIVIGNGNIKSFSLPNILLCIYGRYAMRKIIAANERNHKMNGKL